MGHENTRCKLCGVSGRLCRSHIVPEFAYAPMKNSKNQLYAIGRRVRTMQTGYYERMLCRSCEALLSGYEGAFKRAWMDTIPPDFSHLRTRPLRDLISVAVNDYDAFKLFHLSVLWRAAVAAGFKVGPISLGPYAEQLVALIRSRDPGQVGDFPFFSFLSLSEDRQPVATVSPLARGHGRFDGHSYYMMSYAFCDWIFVIARPGPRWLVDFEMRCRTERTYFLVCVPHSQSKSFGLAVQIIRRLQK